MRPVLAQATQCKADAAAAITGHLIGQTLPAIIGVAAIMSIGLVDAYFIGQLGQRRAGSDLVHLPDFSRADLAGRRV